MPRFFFTVQDGSSDPDPELDSMECADLDVARIEAVRFAGAILNNEAQDFWRCGGWRMDVCDAHGLLLFYLMVEAVETPQAARAA